MVGVGECGCCGTIVDVDVELGPELEPPKRKSTPPGWVTVRGFGVVVVVLLLVSGAIPG